MRASPLTPEMVRILGAAREGKLRRAFGVWTVDGTFSKSLDSTAKEVRSHGLILSNGGLAGLGNRRLLEAEVQEGQ